MKNKVQFSGFLGILFFLAMPSIVVVVLMTMFPFPAALTMGLVVGMCFSIGDIIGINGLALTVGLWSVLSLAMSLTLYHRLRQEPLSPLSIEWSR